MLPTFNIVGDFVLVERLSWRRRRLALGDVILSVSPHDPTRIVCKRILGLPGDVVCKDPLTYPHEWLTVPEGTVWLQGDNLTNSTDSRSYGPVPMSLIRGHVVATVWPTFKWIGNAIEEPTVRELADLDVISSASSSSSSSSSQGDPSLSALW
ncbi:peptidase S24/S26A/S26B/S26C [Entophlyctis helioformis]|nr:peptidase S24/S26A/S26B/S26C [Entophlyctis helioformis]